MSSRLYNVRKMITQERGDIFPETLAWLKQRCVCTGLPSVHSSKMAQDQV